MSFGGYLKGKRGVDLLKRHKINYQLLGLAASGESHESQYRCGELRQRWADGVLYKREVMRAEFAGIQAMVRENYCEALQAWKECPECKGLRDLQSDFVYCPYCKALLEAKSSDKLFEKNWLDQKMMQRFMSIAPEEVYEMGGGW